MLETPPGVPNVYGEFVQIEDLTNPQEVSSAVSLLMCRAVDRLMYEQASRGHMVWVRNLEIRIDENKGQAISSMQVANDPGSTGCCPNGEFVPYHQILSGELPKRRV